MNFDIEDIEASRSKTFNVEVGALEDGTPVGFIVLGTASDEYQKARRASELLGVKIAAASKTVIDMSTDKGAERIVDGTARSRRIVIDHCVVGWFGFTMGGKPAEFTPENLDRLLKARPNWVDILAREIENDANFTEG